MATKFEYYLYDLGFLLKEEALEAIHERDRHPKGSLDYAFQAGRVLAYYEVITFMQQQAAGFDIPLSKIRLEDINPDHDLL